MTKAKFIVSKRDAVALWDFVTNSAVDSINGKSKTTTEEATTKFRRSLDATVLKYARIVAAGRERRAMRYYAS